jgi:hypothetical protein
MTDSNAGCMNYYHRRERESAITCCLVTGATSFLLVGARISMPQVKQEQKDAGTT